MTDETQATKTDGGWLDRALNGIERAGNKLPDPAMLFCLLLFVVWVLSWLLSYVQFDATHPGTGDPLTVTNLLSGTEIATFLSTMVGTFTGFAPLGVVLVAMLGVGVAEHSGFINAALRKLLDVDFRGVVKFVLLLSALAAAGISYWFFSLPEDSVGMFGAVAVGLGGFVLFGVGGILTLLIVRFVAGLFGLTFLTPLLILIAIISHTAVDAGYVVVIPLGGVIFYAAGRHPLAGIAAAFAGVSGGFSANFVPSAIDPLLQGFTQSAAQILDPAMQLNPLNNWGFTSASCLLIVIIGWILTDKVVEPRLSNTAIDGDKEDMPEIHSISERENRAFWMATGVMGLGILGLIVSVLPEGSAMRAPDGMVASFNAPLMQSIVPLIFLLFVVPGVVFGMMSGSFSNTDDIVKAMSKAMEGMAYYIVMAFFCALFIDAFGNSGLGTLLSVGGGNLLKALALPGPVTLMGIIFLVGFVNLFVGSASAKWALLAPIFVPMLMQIGFSPDLTQAAYRVGDSATNIITPLMPYFPLVVVYCRRYVKGTGIGTLVSMMLPYSVTFLIVWSLFLIGYWMIGLPLGLQASYTYP